MGFFLFDRFRALHESLQIRAVAIFLFPSNLCHILMTDLTINNFACESCDEFRACTIENSTVVNRGYFSPASSHSKTVAPARRVYHMALYLNFLTPKILKMCNPILVTLIKMQPHNSQSSRGNATPSSSS